MEGVPRFLLATFSVGKVIMGGTQTQEIEVEHKPASGDPDP
jgi:hypothetical protein